MKIRTVLVITHSTLLYVSGTGKRYKCDAIKLSRCSIISEPTAKNSGRFRRALRKGLTTIALG